MKRIRWPFWAALGAGGVAWLILGFTLPQTTNFSDVFNGGALAACGFSLAFIVIYTGRGLFGGAKWWKTNVGTYMILAAMSVLAVIGPVAAAVLFHNGQVDTWWWAWTWIGGHYLAAVVWALLAILLARNAGNGNGA